VARFGLKNSAFPFTRLGLSAALLPIRSDAPGGLPHHAFAICRFSWLCFGKVFPPRSERVPHSFSAAWVVASARVDSSVGSRASAKECLDFFQCNLPVLVGVDRFEDFSMRCLDFLK
jgi:hypothetical protein